MEFGYTAFYIEANIICIIIFMIMLVRELGSVGRQTKQLIFINITISHILYFLSDIGWVLILGGYLPDTRLLVSIYNVMNAILLSAITGSWFVYVELAQGEKYITEVKGRIIAIVPAMVEAVFMLIMFLFIPGLVINENNRLTDTYYIVFLIVPAMYVAVSSIRAFIRAFKKENYAVRAQFLTCGIYPVIITVFGIMQTVWLRAPLFCFGCAIMMLYVYIISLNDQVSIDELTRLNNRTQLKKYVAGEALKQGSEKITHFVLMIDLNKFKQINDQYGHVEGDYALKRTADALKIACSDLTVRTFIARYGGDEFIIIAKTEDEEIIKELSSGIKDTLLRLNKEAGAKYELSASVGYASYSGDILAFQAALAAADESLYEEKAKRGSAN